MQLDIICGAATHLNSTAWYTHGIWPLIGAISAIAISNLMSVALVHLNGRRVIANLLQQRRIERASTELVELYNPLFTMLRINAELFKRVGPPAFPIEELARNASAKAWRIARDEVVVNNTRIRTLISEKSHLLSNNDPLDNYTELLIHITMYETFTKVETDWYSNFKFPQNIIRHVELMRAASIERYKGLIQGRAYE